MSDHISTSIVDRIAMLDPGVMAGVIDEALQREGELMTRIGRRRLIEGLLRGQVEVRKIECTYCRGKGKRTVEVERSGGSFYDEERTCGYCDGAGRVQRVFLPHDFFRLT